MTEDSPNIMAALQLAAGVAKAAFVASHYTDFDFGRSNNFLAGLRDCNRDIDTIYTQFNIYGDLHSNALPVVFTNRWKSISNVYWINYCYKCSFCNTGGELELNAFAIGSVAIINHITFHCIPFAVPCSEIKCSPLAF